MNLTQLHILYCEKSGGLHLHSGIRPYGWLADRQAGRWVGREAGRQASRQAGRQAGRQADRQTGRLAERWAVKIHVRFEILKACSRSKYSIFCFLAMVQHCFSKFNALLTLFWANTITRLFYRL